MNVNGFYFIDERLKFFLSFGVMRNRYCYKFVLSKVSFIDVCVEKKNFKVMFWIKIFFDCILEFFYF